MPSNQYMYSMRWDDDGFPGCCAANELYRLRASYADQSGSQRRYLTNVDGMRWRADSPRYAFPIELGFLMVLEEMYYPGTTDMWVAFDNMGSRGDVHTGPFSTKNFIKWAIENNYIVATSHRRTYMKGWIFHLNLKTCRYAKARRDRAFHEWRDANV